ncbi:MAG: PHP domain-containing protein [Candidatus Methylopumilus sp.]|nr:PHP domain-containing protein [Candidatus Methylopumilus sp.]
MMILNSVSIFMIDLHSHSTISDGLLTPRALLQYAKSKGIKVLSLTDHDDVEGLKEASEEAMLSGIHLIHGVEISVTWKRSTIHIVGLNINSENEALLQGLSSIREGRFERAKIMAHALDQIGIKGSLEGALKYAKSGILGRTHFARFLVAEGYAKDVRTVFKNFLVKGKPGFVEHTWTTLENALSWIHESGGIATIAHPARYDLGKNNLLMFLNEFKEIGGKGIEVITGSHTKEQSQKFASVANELEFFASTGSDYHGPGISYREMGSLPNLPQECVPIWKNWNEVNALLN